MKFHNYDMELMRIALNMTETNVFIIRRAWSAQASCDGVRMGPKTGHVPPKILHKSDNHYSLVPGGIQTHQLHSVSMEYYSMHNHG
jgi:hypothetical protein